MKALLLYGDANQALPIAKNLHRVCGGCHLLFKVELWIWFQIYTEEVFA